METKNEEWRDVRGFEGLYQVSNLGRVRGIKGKILSPSTYQGYKRVNLSDGNGKYKTIAVHRLVAMMFVEGYAEGLEVNHIDENPANNHADNLEWVTHAKNVVHGTFTPRRMKTLHKTGRIKNIIQKDINGRIIAKFNSVKEAAEKTGVPMQSIRNVLHRGVRWRRDFIWEFAD